MGSSREDELNLKLLYDRMYSLTEFCGREFPNSIVYTFPSKSDFILYLTCYTHSHSRSILEC